MTLNKGVYTPGWTSITAVDLDGDGQDELLFYRNDGLYRFYDVRPNGVVGSPIKAGVDFTKNWTSVTSLDLDCDRIDEMHFYRSDGLFRFYDVTPQAYLKGPIRSGDHYATGWTSVVGMNSLLEDPPGC